LLAANVMLPIPAAGGFSGTFTEATNNAPAGATVTLTSYTSAPAGAPAPLAIMRTARPGLKARMLSASAGSTIFWVSHTYSAGANFDGFPSTQWQVPNGVSASGPFELETFDGTTGILLEVEDDTGVSGNLVSFPGHPGISSFTEVAGHTYWWELIHGFPSTPSHLYFSDGLNPGSIRMFALPIAVASSPVATIAGDSGPAGMAFDASHRLFVANNGTGHVQVFTQPITNGAIPAFTLATGHVVCAHGSCFSSGAIDVAFDTAGDLFVASRQPTSVTCDPTIGCFAAYRGEITKFAAPVTSSSTASFVITDPATLVTGVAFDGNGDLWAINGAALEEYTPPFSASSVPAISLPIRPCCGVAFDSAGNMYVNDGTAGVDVFLPPFSGSMTKAFTISQTLTGFLAFDAAGLLYVTTFNQPGGDGVLVFAPPFNGASSPVSSLGSGGGLPNQPGVALGP
jgi:hypothetical protein